MDFSDARTRERIRESAIIIGVDRLSGRTEVFFGKALLTLHGAQHRLAKDSVLFFALNHSSDEAAQLAAAVRAVKGSCDVPSGEES